MKVSFEDKHFSLSEISYEMLQLIITGIECQRKKIVDKISEMNSHLFKGYSEDKIKEIKIQIEFLKEKNKELTETIESINKKLEDIDFVILS